MTFGGDKKVGASFLTPIEQRFISWAAPKIPRFIRTHHLTLASLPISGLIIASGYLAKSDVSWLWATSALIALQWLTDSLDGAIGRLNNEGLIRWGYYMDHFLDYFFLCSVLITYALMLPDHLANGLPSRPLMFLTFSVFGGFMVNAYLAFAATNEFRIVYFGVGPTEIRIALIIINTLIIIFGRTHLAGALPYALLASFIGLCAVVYRTQKYIWELDMRTKQLSANSPPASSDRDSDERRDLDA